MIKSVSRLISNGTAIRGTLASSQTLVRAYSTGGQDDLVTKLQDINERIHTNILSHKTQSVNYLAL